MIRILTTEISRLGKVGAAALLAFGVTLGGHGNGLQVYKIPSLFAGSAFIGLAGLLEREGRDRSLSKRPRGICAQPPSLLRQS